MSSQTQDPAVEEVAALIRKQLRRDTNTRFLRGMPVFRTDLDMPEAFRLLLSRLERAERLSNAAKG